MMSSICQFAFLLTSPSTASVQLSVLNFLAFSDGRSLSIPNS